MLQPPEAGKSAQPPFRVRSRGSRVQVYVMFCNRSPRTVLLMWIDFQGRPESCGSLQPQACKRIKTYTRHPWMFRDAETDDPMIVNNKVVFLPKWPGNYSDCVVNITLPVFSLRERCLQVVRKLVHPEDIPRLEIARSLQEDLTRRPSIISDLQRINRKVQQNREERRKQNT